MFNRIRQFFSFYLHKLNESDYKLAKQFLSRTEYQIFNNMGEFEKIHSIKVLKDMQKHKEGNMTLYKLALLHDCGKSKDTKMIERIFYVIKSKFPLLHNIQIRNVENHEKKGSKIVKPVNNKLATLILSHHKKDNNNRLIDIFQKYDNRN